MKIKYWLGNEVRLMLRFTHTGKPKKPVLFIPYRVALTNRFRLRSFVMKVLERGYCQVWGYLEVVRRYGRFK